MNKTAIDGSATTEAQQPENPPMACLAFHRISVVQPENCYNCVHRHGYPQYLFGDENCSSFIRSRPHTPAPERIPLCSNFGDIDCCPVKEKCPVIKFCTEHYKQVDVLLIERNQAQEAAKQERERVAMWCNQRWFEVEDDEGTIHEVILKGDVLAILRGEP